MLSGRTALIVEAQYLIALDLENLLAPFSPETINIAQNAAKAMEQRSSWQDCALAIVEVERDLPEQIAFIGELQRDGVAVIGLTADMSLPQRVNWLAGTSILVKPVRSDDFVAAVESVLRREAPQNE